MKNKRGLMESFQIPLGERVQFIFARDCLFLLIELVAIIMQGDGVFLPRYVPCKIVLRYFERFSWKCCSITQSNRFMTEVRLENATS